jgi:hypothetical protein
MWGMGECTSMSTGYFSTKKNRVFEGELTHTDPDMVDLFINVFIFFEDVFVFLVHVEPEICV